MLLLSSCVPQSRLEGRRLSAADFAAAEAHSMANGISGSDSSTTDGMGNGYSQSIREAVDAWWEIAEQRFTTEEVRFCSLFTESATLCSYQIRFWAARLLPAFITVVQYNFGPELFVCRSFVYHCCIECIAFVERANSDT